MEATELDEGIPKRKLWERPGSWMWLSWAGGFGAMVVAWGLDAWAVPRPHPFWFVGPMVLMLASVFGCMVVGVREWLRDPERLSWVLSALWSLVPVLIWVVLGGIGYVRWTARWLPNDPIMAICRGAGASLIRLEGERLYRYEVETDRLVMRHDDRILEPEIEARVLDAHLARMEAMFGQPMPVKPILFRGMLPMLRLADMSVHGLALGSGEGGLNPSVPNPLDLHELAHAAIDCYRLSGADPPFVIHEGWAEFMAEDDPVLLARTALEAQLSGAGVGLFGMPRTQGPLGSRTQGPSKLRVLDLFGPDCYHRDDGPVYTVGGAFVAFLVREHGAPNFLRFFNEVRPDRVDVACLDAFGQDLDALETAFWADARRLVETSQNTQTTPPNATGLAPSP